MGGARLPRLDMTPPQAARTLQRITDSLNAATLAAMPGGGHGTLGSISCQTPPLWPLSLGVPLLAVSVEAGMFGTQELYQAELPPLALHRGTAARCSGHGAYGVRCAVAVASPAPNSTGRKGAGGAGGHA
jgi:hypothetical protein